MQELNRDGRAKAIGVSNFYPDRLVDPIDNNEVTSAGSTAAGWTDRPQRRNPPANSLLALAYAARRKPLGAGLGSSGLPGSSPAGSSSL